MEILKYNKIRLPLSILVAVFLSCAAAGIVHSISLSSEDRKLGNDSSSVFSPGYINAAKQHTESIINQTEQKQGFWQRTIEFLQNKLAANTEENAGEMVTPDLKKKKSPTGDNTAKTTQTAQSTPEMLDPESMMSNILTDVISKQGQVTLLDNGNVVTMWHEDGKPYFSVMNGFGETIIEKQFIAPVEGMQYSNINNIYDMGQGKFLIGMWGVNSVFWGSYYSGIYGTTYTWIDDLRQYDSVTGEMEASQTFTSTKYGYRDKTGPYIYDGSLNLATNLTYLGDGSLAMIVSSTNYHYSIGSMAGPAHSSANYSLRILENNLQTFKDYTLNDGSSILPVNGITSLGNGQFVLAHRDVTGTNFTVMDKDLNEYGTILGPQSMTHIASLGNGKFAVGWRDYAATENLRVDTFALESGGENSYYLEKKTSAVVGEIYPEHGDPFNESFITDMKALNNGSLVLAINTGGYTNPSIKLLDDKGDIKDIAIGSMSSDAADHSIYLTNLITLGDTFGVVFKEENYDSDWNYVGGGLTAQQFSSDNSYSQPYTPDSTLNSLSLKQSDIFEDKNKLSSLYLKEPDNMNMALEAYNQSIKESADNTSNLKANLSINLLAANEALRQGINANIMASNQLLMKLNTYIMNSDALSSYSVFSDTGSHTRLMASAALLNMLKNPAEGQEDMANTILALFNDISKKDVEGESILSGGEADGLIKAIAAVMLAQAMPDLISGNDLANMKHAFLELSMERNEMLKNYEVSTKSYYDEMVKEIVSNLNILRLNNMISKEIKEKDLVRMPRDEIDKIIEKIGKEQKISAETEHIIQQEVKYRQLYIDPNKKIMEERMKAMIKNYVNKVNSTMESASKDMASRKKK